MNALAFLNLLWNAARGPADNAPREHSQTYRYVLQPDGTYTKETLS